MSTPPQLSPTTQLADPRFPTDSVSSLSAALAKYLKLVQQQINRVSGGSIAGCSTASTSPPPSNSVTLYAQGDFIRNSHPTVLGTAGSRYILFGWSCVSPGGGIGGKPATFVEVRTLTGT